MTAVEDRASQKPAVLRAALSAFRGRRRNTLLVLTLALSLRVLVCVYALHHFGAAWFFNRGTEMGFVARSLLSGQGFSSPFGPPSGPTALIAPAYPLFVAAVFRCAGMDSPASALLLMLSNALLNTATIALVLSLARKLASERAAVLAASIPACALPLLWMPSIFWETSVSALLLLGCIALAATITAECSRAHRSAVGAMFALAALVNPALLPTLIVSGSFAALACLRDRSRRGSALQPALALLSFVVVFSPWPVRNYHALHAFIPTRSTVGLELWMGNRDGSAGFLEESTFPTYNAGQFAHYQALGEVSYMAEKSTLARTWIRQHPGAFLMLTLRRMVRFWMGTGNRHGSLAYAFHAGLTTLGAVLGLWVCWARGQRTRLLAGLVAAMLIFPLPYYLTHAEFRYRLVLDPVLCVLSAVAIDWLPARRLLSRLASGGQGVPDESFFMVQSE